LDFKYSFDEYSKDSYGFPKDDIDPSKKNKEWCKAYSEAILSHYYRGRTGITFDLRSKFELFRSYSEGRQSSTQYKNIFLGNQEGDEKREGWMNVNFDDIFSPAPSIVQKIQGIFQSTEHDVQVEDTGIKAGATRETKKESLWFDKIYEKELGQINQLLGTETEQKVLPETREELELFATLGGFKLSYETFMEQLIDISFYESNNKWIKDKLIKDFIDLNIAATMDVVNTDTQRVTQQYVDVADLIIDYSKTNDFQNSNFAALPEYLTINELRKKTGLDEDYLKQTAILYRGYLGNPQFWNDGYGIMNSDGTFPYGGWKVPVLYSTWKSLNRTYKIKKTRANGTGTAFYDGKFGKYWDTEFKKTTITDIEVVYQCRWVIGTDIVFDDGMMTDIVREGKTAKLPFHVYKLPGKSMMEAMIPVLDDIEKIRLRYQNAVAMCPPPGLAIEWGAMENITVGNKTKADPYKMVNFWRQTGSVAYRRTDLAGGSPSPMPISPLPNGMGTIMVDTIQGLNMAFQQLSQVSGIDPVTLSLEQGSGTSATQQKLSLASTNNCLKPIYNGYIYIKESYAKSFAYRAQLICKYNEDPTRGYNGVIGDVGVKAIATAGDKDVIQFGIKIQARPNEEEKKTILDAANESMRAGKNGMPGITLADYLFVSQLVRTASGMKYAYAYLNYREQVAQAKSMEIAKANSQSNGQIQIDADNNKTQNEIALDTAKTKNQIQLEYFKALFQTEVNADKIRKDAEAAGIQTIMSASMEQTPPEEQEEITPVQ